MRKLYVRAGSRHKLSGLRPRWRSCCSSDKSFSSGGARRNIDIDLVPFIGYHHLLMLLGGLAIILYCKTSGVSMDDEFLRTIGLLLSGCSTNSPSNLNIYLISLSYQKSPMATSDDFTIVNPHINTTFAALANDTQLEVRAGYFGICAKSGREQDLWLCDNDAGKIARQFQPQQDPLNLIWTAARFKNGIIFSGLM